MKRKAFTLAEILIVLAVIGVVATLTLPGLMMNYREKTYIAQLQRTYNSLANAAVAQMVADDVDDLTQSTMTDSRGLEDFIKKNLKVSKDCGGGPGECFASSYSSLEKNSSRSPYDLMNQYGSYRNWKCYALATGSSVCVSTMNWSGSNIIVDTNGQAGPNINGRDFFMFQLYGDGTMGSSWNGSYSSSCYGFSYGCFGQIVGRGWKMYY